MTQNEKGLTLIEILITITILSFVGIIIWGIFFQGYNYTRQSLTKNSMHQEANLILSNLTKIHQTAEDYKISYTPLSCDFSVSYTENGTKRSIDFNNSQICFEVSAKFNEDNGKPIDTITPEEIIPSSNNVYFSLSISDRDNEKNLVSVKTILYRLKDDGINDKNET